MLACAYVRRQGTRSLTYLGGGGSEGVLDWVFVEAIERSAEGGQTKKTYPERGCKIRVYGQRLS
jgi:hypothetical protein